MLAFSYYETETHCILIWRKLHIGYDFKINNNVDFISLNTSAVAS